MARRAFSTRIQCLVLFAMSATASVCSATVPVLQSAVSRMNHFATPYDVLLPLTGGTGIECRTLANGLTIIATFDQPVVSGMASIQSGTATAGTPTFSGNTMTIPLTGVINFQTIALNVTQVKNAGGDTLASATIPLRTLTGNVAGSGFVGGSDVNIVRAAVASGAPVNGANFRCDINAQGFLSGSDVNIIRYYAALGSSVTGGATSDTAPTFATTVPNQTAIAGSSSTPAGFTVASTTAAMNDVAVVAATSDPVTIPVSAITISGSTSSRSISITPPSGLAAVTTVTITLTVSDGLMSTTSSFTVTVSPPPTTYLATLQPVAGTNSFGSGSATLVVSGDQTKATLTYSYSNLSGADSDDAIYAPGNDVLFDISAAASSKQANGSYIWTFKTTVTNTIAFTLQTIQNNQAYITIESSAFPNGELTGVFQLVTGSQSFTAPQPPPAITINPPTANDASRFLQQAGFGGQTVEISNLSDAQLSNAHTALNDWLTAQYASQIPIYPSYGTVLSIAPSNSGTVTVGSNTTGQTGPYTYSPSSMYAQIYLRTTQAQSPNAYGDPLNDDRIHESWYKNVVTRPDQLRQRVATALSELFVISQVDGNIDGNNMGNAGYYDMLANDAFGNFRTILGDVTLNPCMGEYLNMAGNGKTSPNENYAREIMQLFTIGLYMLQPDGTLQLDINGQPIPTYTQPTITQFAQVYTGWNYGASVNIPTLPQPASGPVVVVNVGSSYNTPMVVTGNGNNHNTASKTLLNYTNAATFPGASQPAFIPANSSQTATTAAAELNFALDNIFNHPNVGPFVCKRLIQRMVESNPSPAYVYRVAQVFNNDGTGVRGNMQAVITAMLTDYEARSPATTSLPGFGHEREPMIRMVNILRSLNGRSTTGKWYFGKTDTNLAQTIFRSPTVFNFFDPAYQQPGAVQQAGLVSPEMDIVYETTIVNAQNMIYNGVFATYNTTGAPDTNTSYGLPTGGQGFHGDNESTDCYLDFSTASGSGLCAYAKSNGINALVGQVGLLLMGAAMDPTMQSDITSYITSNYTTTNYIGQVEAAVYLVATSSQCSVQK